MMEVERDFFLHHLYHQILPFWDRAFDPEEGGIFTCWTNDGKTLTSTDKYTWSQGRMLWCLSKLIGHDSPKKEYYYHEGQRIYELLGRGAILSDPDEGVAFLLDKAGTPKGKEFYTSLYADCFVSSGFARWGEATKNEAIVNEAYTLYQKTKGLIARGIIKSEPYPIPATHRSQGVDMIMCNTAHELSEALKAFDPKRSEAVKEDAKRYAHHILDFFVDKGTHQLREVVNLTNGETTLLERHRNPGHTLECLWFILDVLNDERIDEMIPLLLTALEEGWDDECGGIYRYIDREGGEPRGEREDDAFSTLIAETWDYKLWWVHVEALYALARFTTVSHDPAIKQWYEKVQEYTFTTFPAKEEALEWIQIRKRTGVPQERVIALPVKDPYHIIRALILLSELEGVRNVL